MPENRWLAETGGTRGPAYAQRFADLAAEGHDLHGEARFVDARLGRGARVLDAGCGTGRIGIELARRGHAVVGVDLDASMLAEARAVAPEQRWLEADLATLDLGQEFDAVVLAGNVLVYLTPGTEAAVVSAAARHAGPAAPVVAGFVLDGRYALDAYDADCAAAGLVLVERYATWDADAYTGGEYAVSVHRRG